MTTRTLKVAAIVGAIGLAGLMPIQARAQYQPPAPDVARLVTPTVIEKLRGVLQAPLIVMSVEAQNDRRMNISSDDIDKLDKIWRAERKSDDQPLIAATMSSPASSYLTQIQADSVGLYSALFVMDKNGLNVGQSAITSDYWQGDEDKFLKTFPVAMDAVFIDAPEYQEDLKFWMVQVNLTLAHDGTPIGSATVELNLTELARRSGSAY